VPGPARGYLRDDREHFQKGVPAEGTLGKQPAGTFRNEIILTICRMAETNTADRLWCLINHKRTYIYTMPPVYGKLPEKLSLLVVVFGV
jgi:hypothetical protein